MVDGIMYSCGCIYIFRGEERIRVENYGTELPIYVDGHGPKKRENRNDGASFD